MLRREHFDEVAGKIDLQLNHVAWTTGSELLASLAPSSGISTALNRQFLLRYGELSTLVRASCFVFGQISLDEF